MNRSFKTAYDKFMAFISAIALLIVISVVLGYKAYLEIKEEFYSSKIEAAKVTPLQRETTKGCTAMPDDILVCDEGVDSK